MTESQLVGGVHMPKTEVHLVDMMIRNGNKTLIREGKATYQFRKLEAAMKHVTNRKLALDVGGHVGLWSMWMVKDFDRVIAFEPVPEHADLFELNVDMTKATLLRHALGDYDHVVDMEIPLETTGNAHFAIGKRHPGTRHVPNLDAQRTIHNVQVKTLDSIEGLDDVGFIKIDTEGTELNVVRGAENLIRRAKPIMIVEQKKNESAYGHEEDAARKLLQSWGMKEIKVISGDWILGW